MKKNDIKLIVILIVVVIILFVIVYFLKVQNSQNSKSHVVVTIDGKVKTYSLDKDGIITLKNKMKIMIQDKKVKVIKSPCKNKVCIKKGEIAEGSETIVCLPNKTFITIDSNKQDKFDSKVE